MLRAVGAIVFGFRLRGSHQGDGLQGGFVVVNSLSSCWRSGSGRTLLAESLSIENGIENGIELDDGEDGYHAA